MSSYSGAYQTRNAVLEGLEQNASLFVDANFIERMKAMDMLELHMLDMIGQAENDSEEAHFIERVEVLKQKLDNANDGLFAQLLGHIRSNDCATVSQYIKQAGQQSSSQISDLGYDELDMLVNGLLEVNLTPSEPDKRDVGMMFYQPTPARIILKLIEELEPAANDIFYDLGSGIGHVPIMMTLLTGIKSKGVELENSYIQYSEECLNKLSLPSVEFINVDARHADYSDGTIFYLYTPFRGEVLQQVLARLETESKQRPIRVCAYGPCTLQVSKQNWLRPLYQTGKRENNLGIFASV